MTSFFYRINLFAKWLLFPGLDLHTRCRYRFLPSFFKRGSIDTLDAGCGNGALSWAAYKLGNRVLGVTNNPMEVKKANDLFSFVGADANNLKFEVCNLYDLSTLGMKFDQIICSETLEHIKYDKEVVQNFYNILKPDGLLHLCTPHSLHPDHNLGRYDEPEDGGHVRDGYTLESYRSILHPIGFEIIDSVGLGTPALIFIDKIIRLTRNKFGDFVALPIFFLTWTLQYLDSLDPDTPYSIYVRAIKR